MTIETPPTATPIRTAMAPRPAAATHIPWIDNLRIAVITGVIVVHAATAYVVEVDWYYTERTTSELSEMVLSYPAFVGAVFGLGPLFLLAGMLSERALARRGARSLALGRILRLGAPLATYVLVIGPLASYFGDRGMGVHVALWQSLWGDITEPDLGPAWFIAALLCFTLAFAALAAVRHGRPHSTRASLARTAAVVAVFIAAASFVGRLWISLGEDAACNLTLAEWPQAAGLFTLGVAVERNRWLPVASRWQQRWAWAGAAGIAAWTALAAWSLLAGGLDRFLGGWHWQASVSTALEGLTAVALSLAIVAWFQGRWNHAGPTAQRAGRGDYAAYLLHPLVLVWLSMLARPLPVAPELKLLLVGSAGAVASFAVGYAVSLLPGVPLLRRVVGLPGLCPEVMAPSSSPSSGVSTEPRAIHHWRTRIAWTRTRRRGSSPPGASRRCSAFLEEVDHALDPHLQVDRRALRAHGVHSTRRVSG